MSNTQFSNLLLNTISAKSKNIFEDIFKNPKDRRGFAYNNQIMVTPVFFYRIIGVQEENKYYDDIYYFDLKLAELRSLYIKFHEGLEKSIPNEFIYEVNMMWKDFEGASGVSAKEIVNQSQKKNIFPYLHEPKDILLEQKLILLLEMFMKIQNNLNIVKNFFIKIMFWLNKYIISPLSAYEYGGINPKALFYGEIQRDEIYFLLLLSLLGFDIIYFHSSEENTFGKVPNIDVYSNEIKYINKVPLKPFPIRAKVKKEETLAYQASKEIHEVLHTEESGFYRPWQFEDHEVISVPLRTTYDELFILWKEEARFRPGFRVVAERIFIPNIFGKISGTLSDMEKYWENLEFLKEKSENTIFIENIPFTNPISFSVHHGLFRNDGLFHLDKLKKLKQYSFSYLRSSVQNLILRKINELISSKDIFTVEMSEAFKYKILYTILNIDKNLLNMLQTFDYPLQVPKVVIFNGKENTFNEEDMIILAFLHLVGVDIVVFTPTGYNNLEIGMNKDYYDIHKLEDFKFNLNYIEISKRKKNIKKLFNFFK